MSHFYHLPSALYSATVLVIPREWICVFQSVTNRKPANEMLKSVSRRLERLWENRFYNWICSVLFSTVRSYILTLDFVFLQSGNSMERFYPFFSWL